MSKFSEQTLDAWRKPASQTEEQQISNAISMIKDAINAHEILKPKQTEFVVQGSYANNTNVKLDSDIDICVMLKDTFYSTYREGASREDYGFTEGTNDFSDYRSHVIKAIIDKFGTDNVTVGNKSIKIDSNSYRVQADVVPAFQFRNYKNDTRNDPENYVEGIKFYSSDSEEIINYPKVHVENGISKNTSTARKFKRVVRLYKRIKNKMVEDGLPVPKNVTSFLLEGMVWNVPNRIFNDNDTWNKRLRESIVYLWNDEKNWGDYGEVCEHFYLFHTGRKWTKDEAKDFLRQMWNYLQYN